MNTAPFLLHISISQKQELVEKKVSNKSCMISKDKEDGNICLILKRPVKMNINFSNAIIYGFSNIITLKIFEMCN